MSAHEFVVPGPLILGIGRGMDTHVAAARLNVPLESGLLFWFSTLPVVQLDYRLVMAQTIVGKVGRVFGGVDPEAMFFAQL